MTPDLPPEPSTPSPLNVDVSSGPPAHQTVEEFYDVLERSSIPSVEGPCPSYEESHAHPSSLLAIVLERRNQQPVQAVQLFSPSSNIAPDDDDETWLTGPFVSYSQPVEAHEISSLQESVHPDEPGLPGKSALKHPLDSELEAFLDPSVPRIESASESEGEGRRPSPFKKSVTFDDDTLWHIIEERDNDYYGLGHHSDGEEDEVLLPATTLKRRASESAASSPLPFTKKHSKGTQSPELPELVKVFKKTASLDQSDVPPIPLLSTYSQSTTALSPVLHGDEDEEPAPKLILKPSSWKRELEAYMDEEEAAGRPVQQQQLQPAPVQERNHMASEELEAFLASISEPATEGEDTVEDSKGDEETTDEMPEQVVSIGHPVLVDPEESGEQSTDTIDSAPEFLAPQPPQRSMSVTSTASLILDDVHSMRLPGERSAEEEIERVHRSVHPSTHTSADPAAIQPHEEVSDALEHPVMSPEIQDDASTAEDSSRSGSFAFKDSSRSSSTTSSQPVSSSASTIISSSPEQRAPGVRIGLVKRKEDEKEPAESMHEDVGEALEAPSEREHLNIHGTVTMTYEVEEEVRYRPSAAAAAGAAAGADEPMEDEGPVQMLYGHYDCSFKRNPFEEPKQDSSASKGSQVDTATSQKQSPKRKPARPPPPKEHSRFIPVFTPTIVRDDASDAPEVGKGLNLPDDVLIPVEKRSNDYYFGQPVESTDDEIPADRPRALSIPDLVIDEVPGDDGMEVEEHDDEEAVIKPPAIRPLKIRLPSDKSMEEKEAEHKTAEKPKHPLDAELEAFLDPSVPRIESESSPEETSPESDSEASSVPVDDEEDASNIDDIILEGDATPRHLNADDMFAEPPPKKLTYSATEANDLAVAAFEKLMEHSHTPGDPLEGAVVTTAYIESDSEMSDGAMIKGQRIVLVGKHRNLLRRSSDGEDEVKVEEVVSDGEGNLRTVRQEEHEDEGKESEDEEGTEEDVSVPASDKPNDTEELGKGLELPDDVLIAVEKRSNEYYFPPMNAESNKPIDSPASSVETVIEESARPRRDTEEGMLHGVDLLGESEEDEPRPLEKSDSSEHLGRGIELPDDVLIAVEQRSNEYYFPDAGKGTKQSFDSPASSVETVIEEPSRPKRDAEEGMLEGVDLIGDSVEDGPRPIEKPHDSEELGRGLNLPDDVLIDVENRSNEYYFPVEETHLPALSDVNKENPDTNRSPLIATSMETDEWPEETAPLPPPPTFSRAKPMSTRRKSNPDAGLELPDDVLVAVENRSNEYYFSTDADQKTTPEHYNPHVDDATDDWPQEQAPPPPRSTSTEIEESKSLPEPPSLPTRTKDAKDDWPEEHAPPLPPYSTFTQVDKGAAPPSDEMRTFLNLGSGIQLPAEALLEVERRSNEHFFAGDRKKADPSRSDRGMSTDEQAKSNVLTKEVSAGPVAKDIPSEQPSQPSVESENVGAGVDIPGDVHLGQGIDLPGDVIESDDSSIGRSIHLPDDVLLAVEKRSNDYFFAGDKRDEPLDSVDSESMQTKKEDLSSDKDINEDKPTSATIGEGIQLPDDVLLEVEQRSNEYYFPATSTDKKEDATDLPPLHPEEESHHTAPGFLSIPNLPPLDQYIFGPEDTDLRPSARLYQKVQLVEARAGTETIERPATLVPHPPDANQEALVAELNRRTSPRRSDDLPLDQSTPLSNAPNFSPGDLKSLLKSTPTASDQLLATPQAADRPSFDLSGDYLFGIDNRLDSRPSSLPPIGEVRLISAEEGIERFPADQDIPVHRSRSLAPAFISVDLPNLLPSPVPDQSYRTESDEDRYRPQRFITEEIITSTVEELLIIEGSHPPDSDHHPAQVGYSSTSSEVFDPQRYPGVSLVAASDGSFKLPHRFETYLSLEPPGDNDEASEITPRDLNVDAAEVAYYRIAQDAAPSLESSGEFEGLYHTEGEGTSKLMSIQEILRLTDNCDVKSNFGLDVIQEESEAERSSRSARYDIVRMPELIGLDDDDRASSASPADLTIDAAFEGVERHMRASEDASAVAARLLSSLSPSQNVEEDVQHDSDSEGDGEVADWGQTSAAAATAEPFEDDLDYEDDEDRKKKRTLEPLLVELVDTRSDEVQRVIEQLDNRAYSIRDFALTPDAGDVYDSDGLNPSSFREEMERRASEEWIIPSRPAIEEDEELHALEQVDYYETMIPSSGMENKEDLEPVDWRQEETREEFYEETSRVIVKSALEEIEEREHLYEDTTRIVDQLHEEMTSDTPLFADLDDEELISQRSVGEDGTIPQAKRDQEFIIGSRRVREVEVHEEEEEDDTQEDDEDEEEGSYEIGGAVPLSPIEEESPTSSEPLIELEKEVPAQQEYDILEDGQNLSDEVLEQRSNEYYGLPKNGSEPVDVMEEEMSAEPPKPEDDPYRPVPVNGDALQPVVAPSEDSDLVDEKTSDDDDQRPSSTSSSPHEDETQDEEPSKTVLETIGESLSEEVIRAVEERSDEYYGVQEPSESDATTSLSRPVQLVEAVDVMSASGVTRDDGEVRLIRARDAMRVEREEKERRRSSAEVEIRLENESMDSPQGQQEMEPTPLVHPSVSRLGVDSRQPSLDRQSSVASDELDRSSLMRLKLENNLDKATKGHEEADLTELNTADVERFWEYRYNKSPRTMRELEEAKRRAAREAEQQCDKEIRRRTKEEDGANLDAEINRKLAEAESKFLQRDQENIDSMETGRLNSGLSSRSSPSFVVDNLSQGEEDEEINGIPLTASGHFFHLRSSSSSSASTASFNSMGDGHQGRQGRVHREAGREMHGAAPTLTRELGGAYEATRRVGGVSQSASELERLFPYIRHSSYYLNYYRAGNLSMEKQAAPRNDYMLSRGLQRSSSSRDSFGMMRQSASSDFVRDVDTSDRKSVTFRQRIEELVHTPPTIHRRIRAGTSAHSHQIRSILKSQHASNLLQIANDNMLRELEQCVEERDRLSVNISATPADVSQLSPMTQSAQTRYRNHMMEQKERISVMIEDKYALIKETLREEEMPSWLRGKDDSIALTLVDQKRPTHRRLFRRQSSSFFYQSQKIEYNGRGSRGADLVTANDCARKLERLRTQFARRDSELAIEIGDNAGDLLSRISQRLSTSPNRME